MVSSTSLDKLFYREFGILRSIISNLISFQSKWNKLFITKLTIKLYLLADKNIHSGCTGGVRGERNQVTGKVVQGSSRTWEPPLSWIA